MIQERRKFQRSSIFLIANVRDLKSFQQNSSGITADFSQEGIGIESHNICFHRGESLEILLKDPQSELSFSAEGEIVWKRDGWYNCKIGVKFRQITPLTINKVLTLISGVDKIPAESHLPDNGNRESEGSKKEKKADPAAPATSDRPTRKAVNIDESIYLSAIETDFTDKAKPVIDSSAPNGNVNKNPTRVNTKSHSNEDPMPGSDRTVVEEPVINGSQNNKRLFPFLLMLLSVVFLAAAVLTSNNIKRLLGFNIQPGQFVFSQAIVKESNVSLIDRGRSDIFSAKRPPELSQVSDTQDINDASLTGKDKSDVQYPSIAAEVVQTGKTVTFVTTHDHNQNKSLSSNANIVPANDLKATIMFDYKSDIINPVFHSQIENISKALLANPKSIVKINGHADNTGPEMYNLDLSMRRSLAVKKMLLQKGIGSERVKLAFFGESNPVASNMTVSGRMKNRRVEMLVVSAVD